MGAHNRRAAADGDALVSTPPPAPALPAGTVKEQYNYAFGLLRQQEYAEAERALTAFIAAHPTDQLAGNANYWLAETYYVRGDFRKAAGFFAAGYQNFPESNKASDNLLKLGMSLAGLDKKREACAACEKLTKDFPDAAAGVKNTVNREKQKNGCS